MKITDMRAVVSAYLMSAGTHGYTESEIFRRFKYLPKEDVLNELELLWKEEKAQRFTMGKMTIWRATEKINV